MKPHVIKSALIAILASMACFAKAGDPLVRFWRENDGKAIRRLPVEVLPENVFWWFTTRDFSDGMKAFNRLVDEGLGRSTCNCVTLSLRCDPEFGDSETQLAARSFIERAHAAGAKVYMDTDPRIARREFLSRWPKDRQQLASVIIVAPTNGVATFSHEFKDAEDHMTSGARDSYRPLSGRVISAFAAKRKSNGEIDFLSRRSVDVIHDVSTNTWRTHDSDGVGHTDHGSITVKGRASGLDGDEILVATGVADYFSIDVFSPSLIPFERELLMRCKRLGADGGLRDEWGFLPDHAPDMHTFWWSPNLEAAYNADTGRVLMDDFPLMAYGAKGDTGRSAAIGAYMRLVLKRNVEIEQDFYAENKRIFGDDAHVTKHPTWYSCICPQEYFHNGLDWWQATRDWAQGDETTPFCVLNALAKKFDSPSWLNEGYTATPERNVFRVWTYALCGGRQVYHSLHSGDPKAMEKYSQMPWEEGRVRISLDLFAPENVTAQARVRLPNLISRSQVESPVAFVFGHERLVDWSGTGFDDYGYPQLFALLSQGWWCDLFPASEFAVGAFAVDGDGWLHVGRQRYHAVVLHNLSEAERRAFDAIANGRSLKTRILGSDEGEAVQAHLRQVGAVRQSPVKRRTQAATNCPEPDGTLHLIDGTAIRVRADWNHPCGLPIAETIESNGVGVEIEAEGIAAVRCEGGQVVALAAGGLRHAIGGGLSLSLDQPEDVVLLKICDEWHGVWQTADASGRPPTPLSSLTTHWIRLLLPPQLMRDGKSRQEMSNRQIEKDPSIK